MSDQRIPAVEEIRLLAYHLEEVVKRTGPNTPPWYKRAIDRQQEAAVGFHDMNGMIAHGIGFVEALTVPRTIIRGWSDLRREAITLLHEVSTRLMEGWGLTPHAKLPPYPGMEEAGWKLLEPVPSFALLVSDEDHESLVWCLDCLRAALAVLPIEALPAEPIGSEPFLCSKTELLRALGKSEGHRSYLKKLEDAERLVLEVLDRPVGHERYRATFTDPNEHTRIRDAIADFRSSG